jgi:formate-dependent nitrite reductase membrane component NrfD
MSAATASQRIWGWRMASSLFLAGTAAGTFLAGFVMGVGSGRNQIVEVAIPASAILAALAIVMAFSHTARRANFVRAFARPRTSWMSRGAIALGLLLVIAVVDLIPWQATDEYLLGTGHVVVGIFGSLAALAVLVYTGMLLRSLKPVTFWNSAWLPVTFFLGGLAGGALLVTFGLGISMAAGGVSELAVQVTIIVSLCLLVVEGAAVTLYLWRSRRGGAAASVETIVGGAFARQFWIGVVGVGFLVPVILCAISLAISSAAMFIAIGVTGLYGNAILKYLVVAAGRPGPLDVAGEAVPTPVASRMTVSQYMEELKLGR